jgi:protein phosphatase
MNARTFSYAASDAGRVRETNEDYYFTSDALGLYVLADGMGGQPRGEIASRLSVESVVEFISANFEASPITPIEDLAKASVLAAHAKVCDANRGRGAADAMGSTLCVLLVHGQHFAVANVGDTKSYWVSSSREEKIVTQMTRDDNLASSLILKGFPPERVRGGSGGALTQAIGITSQIRPHVVCGILNVGDAILMCSDGITDYMPQSNFRNFALSLSAAPRDLVNILIQAALDGGGGDNCTCICILATS